MRAVTIDITCDECLENIPEQDIVVVPFRFGAKETLLDLCAPCRDELMTNTFATWLQARPSTEPVKIRCTVKGCAGTFNTKSGLKIHIGRIHKEKKP